MLRRIVPASFPGNPVFNSPSHPAFGLTNPVEKLAPNAVRIRMLADELAREGETEIADHVRHVATELEEARPGPVRSRVFPGGRQ